eukprot:363465-Chlamydomonas_euryale.AAC.1
MHSSGGAAATRSTGSRTASPSLPPPKLASRQRLDAISRSSRQPPPAPLPQPPCHGRSEGRTRPSATNRRSVCDGSPVSCATERTNMRASTHP